jgi:phosphonate dehydrogenase
MAARYVQRPGVSAAARRIFSSHPLHPDACALLAAANLELEAPLPGQALPLPRQAVLERTRRAAALIAFMPDTVSQEFLEGCPHLRIVAGVLRGPDNFDLAAMSARGVHFSRCGDLLTAPTAELAVGLAIALGRNVREGDQRVRAGAFEGWRPELFGLGLAGSTVGIVGLGAVGRALAERLRGFGVARVLFTDPDPASGEAAAAGAPPASGPPLQRARDLPALLGASDYVFPLTPLSAATRHLIDARALACMQRHALLVNVGRGGCVDEAAVAAALAAGRLGGYAADVFELEDWAVEGRRRDIPPALLHVAARTVLTPHLGSAVRSVRRAMDLEAAENVVDVLVRGVRPRGAVNELQ